ncbi:hypothetical protein GF420_01560 [candidate division GN15 bacterium]|nr:hypothetical protein [candidate division GN15 bacterium]
MDSDNIKQLIPAYLRGSLSEADRERFEAALSRDPELRGELEELAHLYVGVAMGDAVAREHIDSTLLVQFVLNPDDLDQKTRTEIEEHLKDCAECREEADLTRQAAVQVERPDAADERRPLSGLVDWLLAPRLTVRPATAVVAAALVAVFAFIGLYQTTDVPDSVAVFQIEEHITRSAGGMNELPIDPALPLARLEFVLPIVDDYTYDYELRDAEGDLVLASPSHPPREPMVFELPGSLLTTGDYKLVVTERDVDGEVVDTYTFPIHVSLIE